ncbi:hypothetical protein [Sphingomonas sp.]|uniref:hypothetical protein n=1 Tax=Sphingomonas sp. TaxID=28214 RepID=UPI0031E05741
MTTNHPTPGDELVERARAICAEARPEHAEGFLTGKYDASSTEMRAVLIALRTRDEAARSSTAEVERLRASAQWLASQMTSAEILAADDEHFGSLSAEERIHMMGERRRARDAAILGAREALQSKDHSHAG